jgi:hypothetical protein
MLACAAGEITRFGEQFAVLTFSGSFGATLSEDAEFLRVQTLAPLGVCEFERKHPFRISHEGGPERAKVCGGWANGGVDNSCVEVVKSSVDL